MNENEYFELYCGLINHLNDKLRDYRLDGNTDAMLVIMELIEFKNAMEANYETSDR